MFVLLVLFVLVVSVLASAAQDSDELLVFVDWLELFASSPCSLEAEEDVLVVLVDVEKEEDDDEKAARN